MRTHSLLALAALHVVAAGCSADDPVVIPVDGGFDAAKVIDAPDAAAPDASAPDAAAGDATAPADASPSPRLPRGHLDNADCRGLWGWALDDDAPDVALSVRVRVEGLDLPGTASDPRPDVCAPRPGDCNHGFSIVVPPALRDGRDHALVVYARDAVDGREAAVATGTLRCGDAGAPTPDAAADAPADAPPDVSVTGDDRIQTELTQECTDGDGVTFRARPTHPTAGAAGYTFTWRVTEGSTRLTLNEARDRAHVVLVGDGVPPHTHLELTIARPGYRTLTVPPALLWSSACAHEFNPTRCPENLRTLTVSAAFLTRGEAITVASPEAAAGDVNWYVNQGLEGVMYDPAAHVLRATVTRDPSVSLVVTQSQPGSDPRSAETARCHGWTQRYFVLR